MEDSRLQGYTIRVTHPTLPLERTYCNICGRPKGWVGTESARYIRVNNITVTCDLCIEKYGAPPLIKAPIQEF